MKSDPNYKGDPESVKERLQEKFAELNEKVARELDEKRFEEPEEMQVEL
jgi:hypothetical protein